MVCPDKGGKKKSIIGIDEIEETDEESLYPSKWASYLAKVSEITHMPAFPDVWHRLSYHRGLQFEMVWYYRNMFNCVPLSEGVGTRLNQPL